MASVTLTRLATCLAVVLLASACSPDAGASPSTGSTATTIAAAATQAPTPHPTPRPTPTSTPAIATPTPQPTVIPLEAGGYESVMFEPAISYDLPAGWQQYADTRTWFATSPAGTENRIISIFARPRPAKLTVACVALADDTVGPKANDLVAWLAAHPALTASKPTAATFAGLRGKMIDVTLDAAWTDDCPGDPGRPATSMLVFGDDDSEVWIVSAGQRLRLYIADLPGGGVFVIDVDHLYGSDLDTFLAAAKPIVDSIAIKDLPKPSPTAVAAGSTGKAALSEYGFTVTMPKGWRTVTLIGDDLQAIVDAVPEGMLSSDLEGRLVGLLTAGLRLWAFDYAPADAGSNMSIVALGQPIPESLLLLTAKAAVAQVPTAEDVRVNEVRIDGQLAVRVDMRITAAVAGTSITMTETQLYIPRPGRTLIVTIAIPKGAQIKDRDALVKSIHLD